MWENERDGGVHKELVTDSRYKISDRLYGWCQSKDSVSSLLAANPHLTPEDAWHELIHGNHMTSPAREHNKNAGIAHTTDEELSRAQPCGKWGAREPSDLFVKVSFR